MSNLNLNTLDKICTTACVSHRHTPNGVEILVSNKKVATITSVDDGRSSRIIYPKNKEISHTTYWGTPLTEKLIVKVKMRYAIDAIQNSI